MSETLARLTGDLSARRDAISDSRKLYLFGEPLDGRRAVAARAMRSKSIGRNGPRTAPRPGSAGCRASPKSPTASAQSSAHRRHLFLGPNVSVLQAAIATCIDFARRAQRGRLRSAAVSVAHVRLARMGAFRRGAAHRSLPTTGVRFRPSASSNAITERTAIAVLSHAYYVSGAIADVRGDSGTLPQTSARCSASTPIKRPASIPTTCASGISTS